MKLRVKYKLIERETGKIVKVGEKTVTIPKKWESYSFLVATCKISKHENWAFNDICLTEVINKETGEKLW